MQHDKEYLDEFRMNVKFYRERLGMSQVQLATECDCGTGTIGGIESGKAKPSFDMIVRLSQALQVHPCDLFKRNVNINEKSLRQMVANRIRDILIELEDNNH